jgi:lactate racemase
MHLDLAYGTGKMTAELGWGRVLGTLDIADTPPLPDIDVAIQDALDRPAGLAADPFAAMKPGDRVTVVVSDSFRKTRVERVLPHLLSRMSAAGVRDEDITFLYATGTHRGPTPAEAEAILGPEVFRRFGARAVTHDPRDDASLVHLGTTSRGTPVRLNRLVVETDHLVVTGTVVLHYFGGFGGGRKALLPGVAGVDAIAANHAMNLHPTEDTLDPAVRIATLDGNPVAEDMLEGALMVPVRLLVNTVLDRNGEIAGVFAGDLVAAHRDACAFAARLYRAPIREQADLVIAAAGNTRNFVQTHKALYNAHQAMKPGGRIVLLARCEEGLGGEQFTQWLRLGSRAAIIARLRVQSEINGQTALSTIEKAPNAILVTDMPEGEVAKLGAGRAETLGQALEIARGQLPPEPTVYIMPAAAYTVPVQEA